MTTFNVTIKLGLFNCEYYVSARDAVVAARKATKYHEKHTEGYGEITSITVLEGEIIS